MNKTRAYELAKEFGLSKTDFMFHIGQSGVPDVGYQTAMPDNVAEQLRAYLKGAVRPASPAEPAPPKADSKGSASGEKAAANGKAKPDTKANQEAAKKAENASPSTDAKKSAPAKASSGDASTGKAAPQKPAGKAPQSSAPAEPGIHGQFIRTYDLAKELGMRAKELIVRAAQFGVHIADHRMNLTTEQVEAIIGGLSAAEAPASAPSGAPATTETPAPKAKGKKTTSKEAAKEAAAPESAESKVIKRLAPQGKATKDAAPQVAAPKGKAPKAAEPKAAKGKTPIENAPPEKAPDTKASKPKGPAQKGPAQKGPAQKGPEQKGKAPAPAAKAPKGTAAAGGKSAAPHAEPSGAGKSDALATESSDLDLKPGKVIDLRGSQFKNQKPKENKPQRPRVGPVGDGAKVDLPAPGKVLDLRAKPGAPEARPQALPAAKAPSAEALALAADVQVPDADRHETSGEPQKAGGRQEQNKGKAAAKVGNEQGKGPRGQKAPHGNNGAPAKAAKSTEEAIQGLPQGLEAAEENDQQSEAPPLAHKDISILIVAQDAAGTLGAVLEAVLAQKTPWETEVVVLDRDSQDGTAELAESFAGVRVIRTPKGTPSGKSLDMAFEQCLGEIVVAVKAHVRPEGDDWLVRLTDPFFEDEAGRIGIVDGTTLKVGEQPPSNLEPRSYRRGDRSASAVEIDGGFFAVRAKFAKRRRLSSFRGDVHAWVAAILDAGGERRVEPAVLAYFVEPAEAPTAMSASAPALAHAAPEAPEAPAPAAPEPAAAASAPTESLPVPSETVELWEVPLKIASKTAERWVQIATGLQPRSFAGVLMAPVEAALEVFGSLRR